MQKTSYLENGINMTIVESKLDNRSYFSTDSLPGATDATIFLFLQKNRKVPSRERHPNLYYWYILMKQFALNTLQIWIQRKVNPIHDRAIQSFLAMNLSPIEQLKSYDKREALQKKCSKRQKRNSTPKLKKTAKIQSNFNAIEQFPDQQNQEELQQRIPLTGRCSLPQLNKMSIQ